MGNMYRRKYPDYMYSHECAAYMHEMKLKGFRHKDIAIAFNCTVSFSEERQAGHRMRLRQEEDRLYVERQDQFLREEIIKHRTKIEELTKLMNRGLIKQ